MGELTTKGHKGNFRGDGTILYNDCGDDYMTMHLSKLTELYIAKCGFTVCK